eukprot:jgi/Botrbrau1/5261/Bobra.0172s0120.1
MDCRRNATPQLYYTLATEANEILTGITGYNDFGYELPALNSEPDSQAVENLALEAPVSTAGRESEPLILYPWKASDVGPIGYVKIPARLFEPIFGAWWTYDSQKNAASQRKGPSTSLLQDVVEFPIADVAQDLAAPVLDPVAKEIGELPNELISPFVVQRPLGINLPIIAP